MEITTRISSHAAPERSHYGECTRDHTVNIVIFTSATAEGGFGQTTSGDCMFFEIEDAAHEAMTAAVETSDGYYTVYEDDVWLVAQDIATIADGVNPGESAHVRNKVEVI